jgi:hypothetical protein
MLGLLAVLAAATAPMPDSTIPPDTTTPAPASGKHKDIPLPPPFPVSPLRKLMQAQLATASGEDDGSVGLTAAEADAVMAHYLASIGKPIVTPQSSTQASQSGLRP